MEKRIMKGKIWVLGNNIDTDLIVPSRVLTEQDQKKLLSATFELILPNFAENVKKGDIIIAGKNFGCGSSREEAVFVLKKLGISAIIAESFSRIYFRNCVNLGLPPIKIKERTSKKIGKQGDKISLDLENGIIINEKMKKEFSFEPFPEFIQKYLDAGGAFEMLKQN